MYCINCALKYLFMFASFVGLFPFTRKCTHGNRYLTASFKESPFLVRISYVNAVLLLLISSYEFYYNFNTKISVWKVDNISALGLLAFGVCCSLTMLLLNSHRRLMKVTLDTFSILTNSKFTFVKAEEVVAKLEHLRHMSMIYTSAAVFSTILGAVLPYLATKSLISSLSAIKTYSFCANCFATSVTIDGIRFISELLFDSLKRILEAKIEKERISIYNGLKEVIKIRLLLQQLMRNLNLYASPTVTVFYALTLLFSYSFVYAAIIEILNIIIFQDYFNYRTLWPLVLLHIHNVVQSSANLLRMDDSILSYLYRFPISKLSRKERLQVELLILTLRAHPLIVSPSNIFEITKKLYIRTQYIVVTYVITGLQFYFSIPKEP